MTYKDVKKLIAGATLVFALGTSAALYAESMDKTPMTDQTMMMQMMKLGSPGEHHKMLDVFAGTWNLTVTSKMAPNAPAQTMTGTSEKKWILGNRFIEEKVQGTSDAKMGMPPFEGMGILGYDNIRHEYVSLWMDNMMTGVMEGESKYNPQTKMFTEKGSVSCPMTGEKRRKFRGVVTVIDNNHYTYDMYMMDKHGNEFKSMSIDYQRAQ